MSMHSSGMLARLERHLASLSGWNVSRNRPLFLPLLPHALLVFLLLLVLCLIEALQGIWFFSRRSSESYFGLCC